MRYFAKLATEQPNPASRALDVMPLSELVHLMTHEDARVAPAVRRVGLYVGRAVDLVVRALQGGGRLFLVGAGTSGRLCVMEAAECPPTFNTPPDLVQALIAGGAASVFRSKEGAEDRAAEAERFVKRKVKPGDAVVGVAASGVTPFVLAALNAARRRKASTVLVSCNPQVTYTSLADVIVAPRVGPEVLTGSTRLKAGTACKMVLNMLTTLSMVRLGKVYGHWMVDLQPRSKKLVSRGLRLIENLGRVDAAEAERLFKKADGRVKVAIVMARKGVSAAAAHKLIDFHGGFLHKIIR